MKLVTRVCADVEIKAHKMNKELVDVVDDEFKIYTLNPYKNSKGDFFGVSIKGRAKDYVQAHKNFQTLIQKGKIHNLKYRTEGKGKLKSGKLKFLNVNQTNIMFDTVVEVTTESGVRGNVHMKSYYPSNNKKKGATTELRKHSDFEYDQVEILLSMITNVLDRLIDGESLEDVFSTNPKINDVKDSTFRCETCNFESKSSSGLKAHKTKIHKEINIKCKLCEYMSNTEDDVEKHVELFHVDEKVKKRKNSVSNKNKSPNTSPLRKKLCHEDTDDKEDVALEIIDDMIKDIERKDIGLCLESQNMLHQRIEQLELELKKEKEKNEKLTEELQLFKSVENVKKKSSEKDVSELPKHLTKVHEKHLAKLDGLTMRYCASPDGACLIHCMTAHISCSEDQSEREINRKRINNHIADHFDHYYCNKISLPYTETIGVGKNARKVTYNTNEEFVKFLRSDDALYVFSNYQELLAIANMLNINIKIFSYGVSGNEERCEWFEVNPDPAMSSTALFPKGLIPDMFLYNSDQSHFDLLVSHEHQLVTLGLIDEKPKQNVELNLQIQQSSIEKLLDEQLTLNYDEVDLEELDDEVIHFQAAQNDIVAENPSVLVTSQLSDFKCTICNSTFTEKKLLHEHTLINHEKREFNCYSCSFQASSSSELMKHLRLTGHQPSKALQDLRSKIIVCYTCKEEYTSYWGLMNHRRQKHPSNKVCRYFLRGQCIHGINCWYRHDEPMQVDPLNGSSLECENVSNSSPDLNSPPSKLHGNKSKSSDSSTQDFQKGPTHTYPPDLMKPVMETLKMVLQRMDALETKLQKEQQNPRIAI